MKQDKIKKGILLAFIVFLTYPVLEFVAPFKLSGLVNRANISDEYETLTFENCMEGSFQESFMDYINDNIGLFPFFVKTHNQIEYSFFGIAHTGRVITGKNNYLFEKAYINSYYGENYVGLKKVKKNTALLKSIQDTLAAMGKPLVFCITADKATYFPEYLPEENRKKDTTNYQMYTKYFKDNNIQYIDFNTFFLQMKDSLGYLLYPQYGIHWSHYSTILVTDSIVRYLESNTGWDLPNLEITKTSFSPKAKYHDNDIVDAMNLFIDAQPQPMIYPEFVWKKPKNKQPKRKLLIIGDSFTWDIFDNSKLGLACFDKVQFWYYNQTIHEYGTPHSLPNLTRHVQLFRALKYYDAFIIISNHPNLESVPWSFVKDVHKAIRDTTYQPEERNNDYLKIQLNTKAEWKTEINKRAKKKGISVDSMINVYLHDKNYKPNKIDEI